MYNPDLQRLIGEVAKRHNLLLRYDDPVLVLLTLNELTLNGLITHIEGAVQAAQDQISAGVTQQREAAKAVAEQVIAGGAEHMARANRNAVAELQAAIKSAKAEELAAVKRAGVEAQEARREAWWAAIVATGVGCLLIGAVAASWWQAGDQLDRQPATKVSSTKTAGAAN